MIVEVHMRGVPCTEKHRYSCGGAVRTPFSNVERSLGFLKGDGEYENQAVAVVVPSHRVRAALRYGKWRVSSVVTVSLNPSCLEHYFYSHEIRIRPQTPHSITYFLSSSFQSNGNVQSTGLEKGHDWQLRATN